MLDAVFFKIITTIIALSLSLPSDPNEVVEALNCGLRVLTGWIRTNNLNLNPNKIAVLLAGPSSVLESGCASMLDSVALTLNVSVCSLRLLDPGLLLDSQATVMARAYYWFWLVHQLHLFQDKELFSITHVLVISRIDYCNALYKALPLKMTLNL